MTDTQRYTRAESPKLLVDPQAVAEREVANGLRQFDAVKAEIAKALAKGDRYRLRPSTILRLHREAVEGIEATAGQWRNVPVDIAGSTHRPPAPEDVPELMEELCDRVNDDLRDAPPIDLAAWVLWRICWIHPFSDGNGRTARAISYLVLCAAAGLDLPGTRTIPDQITEDKAPYYEALEMIDRSVRGEEADVGVMADLLTALLARQIQDVEVLPDPS